MKKKKVLISACAAVLLIAAVIAVLFKTGVFTPKKKVYIPEGTTVNVRKDFTAELTEIEVSDSDSETETKAEITNAYEAQSEFPFTVGKLSVSKIFSYSGGFVEDGSDREVESICAIRVRNNSGSAFQYVSLCFKTDAGDILFDFTALPAGGEVTVLAKNAEAYRPDIIVSEVSAAKSIEFAEKPSLHGEMFELSVRNGVLGIRNISADKDASNVYVYYKSTDSNGLFGGITYRINLGDIPAGKFKQVSPPHFSESSSKVMYITYV